MKLNNLMAPLAVLLVVGCASGTTMVFEPPASSERFASASVVKTSDTVAVPSEFDTYFADSLKSELFENGPFSQADGLVVEYRFMQYDEGNRAVRYMVGFGAGKGEVSIEVTFKNQAGDQLSRIQVGGEMAMGLAGGSIKQALDRAAMEAGEYAKTNFYAAN